MNKSENRELENVNRKKNKNFYIAMTLCIAAVSAAGWSTYQSVKNFLSPVGAVSKVKSSESQKNKHLSELDKNNILEKDSQDDEFNVGSKPKKISPQKSSLQAIQPASAEVSKGPVIYPVSKNILKEFSGENPVYSKTFSDWRIHQGTDFKADEGSSVKSVADGTVKDVINDDTYGTMVIIEHSAGFTAYYCGLGENTLVKTGQVVRTGDEIGSIKSVPSEILDEPHLHFMVYKDDKFIDPMLILDNGFSQ